MPADMMALQTMMGKQQFLARSVGLRDWGLKSWFLVGFEWRDASVPCVFFVAAPFLERGPNSLVEQAIPKCFRN